MINEIVLAIIQAATEFFPVSSSGHLALVSNLISEPSLFFFTVLHLASLVAVLIFTRKEIVELFRFDSDARKLWIYLIVATIPAGVFGLLFSDVIEKMFSSYLFLSIAFFFTGAILLSTKFMGSNLELTTKKSIFIGFFQVLALFPGISRSGMTISAGIFSNVKREKAMKFSFLLLIPLVLGAVILEASEFYFSWSLVVSFFVCLFASLLFLNLLTKIVVKNKFWIFSIYCFVLSIISLIIYLS